jgi:hypothetical protein
MPHPMSDRTLPEVSSAITDFDRRSLKTYLRLLDAVDDNADWREVATKVLDLAVECDPQRVRRIYDAYLDRARWMAENGYRDLLGAAQ